VRQPGLFDFLASALGLDAADPSGDVSPPRHRTPARPPAGHRPRPQRTPAPPQVPPAAAPAREASGIRPGPHPVEFVRHPRARRYLIRVRLDGSVRVTIPRRGSQREATAFYEAQRGWVSAQLERVATVRQRLPEDLDEGRQRQLRAQARRELPTRLFELAAPLGLPVRKVSVRNQKHRWGSCSASGLICLNWRLITMPSWVRDYVIYHELMHLKRMDHSPAFWALVEGVCPRYRDARRWLRRHALAPHAPEAHADRGTNADAAGDADDTGC